MRALGARSKLAVRIGEQGTDLGYIIQVCGQKRLQAG